MGGPRITLRFNNLLELTELRKHVIVTVMVYSSERIQIERYSYGLLQQRKRRREWSPGAAWHELLSSSSAGTRTVHRGIAHVSLGVQGFYEGSVT